MPLTGDRGLHSVVILLLLVADERQCCHLVGLLGVPSTRAQRLGSVITTV